MKLWKYNGKIKPVAGLVCADIGKWKNTEGSFQNFVSLPELNLQTLI